MKRIVIFLGVVLAIFILSISSVSGITWHTYREDIAITTAHCTIDEHITRAYVPSNATLHADTGEITNNETYNITLPCNIANLSVLTFRINQTSDDPANWYFNLSLNGMTINCSTQGLAGILGAQSSANITLAGDAGILNSSTYDVIAYDNYVNYSFNCTNGNEVAMPVGFSVEIYAGRDGTFDHYAAVNSTYLSWFTDNITIKEYDMTTPTVGMSQASSFWTVNNSCNVSLNFTVNLTNLMLNITYPGHTVGTPTTTQLNFSADTAWGSSPNNVNGSEEMYVSYQKRGPFVYDVDEEIDGNEHEVTIKLKCEEVLTNVVAWTIDPDDEKYDGVFDTLDFDTLNVKLGTVSKDWEQDGDSIELEDITVFGAIINNKWVFTWTVSVPVIPAVPTMWDSFVSYMVANWLWVLGTIALICAVGGIYIYATSGTSKPRKKKK